MGWGAQKGKRTQEKDRPFQRQESKNSNDSFLEKRGSVEKEGGRGGPIPDRVIIRLIKGGNRTGNKHYLPKEWEGDIREGIGTFAYGGQGQAAMARGRRGTSGGKKMGREKDYCGNESKRVWS